METDTHNSIQPNPRPNFQGFHLPSQNWFKMPTDWTDITNEIDSLAELKVVEYVLRHTWGYQEYGQTKRITLDEFSFGRKRTDGSRLDKGTGLSKPSVISGIHKAILRGLLVEEVGARDRARVRKSYALRMQDENSNQDRDNPGDRELLAGVKDVDSGVKNFYIGGKTPVHRSEKETDKKDTNSNTAAVAGMIRHSLSHKSAQYLAENYSQERIREKIAYLEFSLKRGKPRIAKPSGWLRKAVEDDYEAPEGYVSPQVEARKAKLRTRMQRKHSEAMKRIDLEATAAAQQRKQMEAVAVEQYRTEFGTPQDEAAQWDQVMQALKTDLTAPRYTLLSRAHFLGFEDDRAVLGVFHEYELRQLESNLGRDSLVAETIEEVLNRPVAIQLLLLPPLETNPAIEKSVNERNLA